MSRIARRFPATAAAGVASLLAPLVVVSAPSVAFADTAVGAFANPGDTITVDFPFRADGEQYSWVVPDGVTEVTLELAAGSGAETQLNESLGSSGGPGGHLVARVPVDPTATLTVLVGQQGAFGTDGIVGGSTPNSFWTRGGGASVVAMHSEILAVAGGGGAGYRCDSDGVLASCAHGGAGGYSMTANGPSGQDGSVSEESTLVETRGTGASTTAPGLSRDSVELIVLDSAVISTIVSFAARQASSEPAEVVGGVIAASVGGHGREARLGGGGSGYYGGGHGSTAQIIGIGGDDVNVLQLAGGGGGGSGFLVEGAEVLQLRDNVGDGFASITYVVPEPDVVDSHGPELRIDRTTVRAGDALILRGTDFDPDRDYPVILNSDPVLVGTVTTDAGGAFEKTITIAVSVPAGEHVITVGDGSIPITVLAAAASEDAPPTALADDGETTGPLPESEPELAATGADTVTASILGALALALLAAGVATVRASRQPAPAHRGATPAR